MKLTRAQWDELVAHAREEEPKECCGFLKLEDGRVAELVRARNIQPSPMYGYRIDSETQLAAYKASESGYAIAMYHSHPRSPAEPSQTDINLADWPEYLYVIVSLAGDPEVRAWWIRDRKVEEERMEVE